MKIRIKTKILTVLVIVMAFFNVSLFVSPVFSKDDAGDIEDDINDVQKDLKKEQQNYDNLQSANQTVTSQINSTAYKINKTAEEIERQVNEIDVLEKRIKLNQSLLQDYLRELFWNRENDDLIEMVIFKNSWQQIILQDDNLLTTKDKLLALINEINDNKDELEGKKDELEDTKEEHEKLLAQKKAEKSEIVEGIGESTATITELRKKLAELQSDLLAVTGKSYSAKDIKEAVEYASKKTDVPKGVLYGFLKMETNLGANTGQCTYKQVKKDAIDLWYGSSSKWKSSRALLEKRMDIFYDLVDDLGYSKNKKVSCTPRSYRGQGGAMGVSQFMADVWKSYESSVRSKTGHKNPDPWDITDGVMAMAIKLEKAGATSSSKSKIKQASINYLGAFNANYYNGIVYWSENYKKLFD